VESSQKQFKQYSGSVVAVAVAWAGLEWFNLADPEI